MGNKKEEKFNKIILLSAISAARISSGMLLSIFGPTLLSLANRIDTGVSEASNLFTTLSIGVVIGGTAAGFIEDRFNKMYSFVLAQIAMGALLAAMPFSSTLWLLLIIAFLLGFMFGYLDSGLQAIILRVWTEEQSRPFIALYHFVIAVGGLITPLIVSPFLLSSEADSYCPGYEDTIQNTTSLPANTTEIFSTQSSTNTRELDTFYYAYIVSGAYSAFCGLLLAACEYFKIEDKIKKQVDQQLEQRPEEHWRKVMGLLLLVTLFYFFSVASEAIFTNYLFSVSVCSQLAFSAADGALITTLFWIGYSVSRFMLIFVSNFSNPTLIITVSLGGCIVTLTLEVIWGQFVAWIAWTVAFFFGFFISILYPAGVSWTSNYTNMSEHYIGVFSIGSNLGAMITLPVAGAIFEIDQFYPMYLNVGTVLANAFVFALMIYAKKSSQKINTEIQVIENSTGLTKF